eukprot:1157594-Pelagomonas_calceolata.AAC.1
MGRGLGTKLISNGMQGILFSVLWRLGQDYYAKKEKEKAAAEAADSKAKCDEGCRLLSRKRVLGRDERVGMCEGSLFLGGLSRQIGQVVVKVLQQENAHTDHTTISKLEHTRLSSE